MRTHPSDWSVRHRWLTLGLIICALGVTLAVVDLGHGRHSSVVGGRRPSSAPSTGNAGAPHRPPSSTPPPTPALPATDDPDLYAREVATALFGASPAQTTRAELLSVMQSDLPTVVYSDAAAKGLTLERQNSDAMQNLTKYWVPSQAAWSSEARDNTTNTVTIASVTVPDYWADAVATGKFRDPGLHVERVMGVLAQSYGTNPMHRYRSARPIVIDLALLCGPTQPGGCRLVAPQPPPSSGTT